MKVRSAAILAVLWAVLYLPFVGFGFGANVDSLRVAEIGREWLTTGTYSPSRYPGFPVHEWMAAVLARLGGPTLSNVGTAVMVLLAAGAFMMRVTRLGMAHSLVLTVGLFTNPVLWTTGTYTIDYPWALAFLLAGWALASDRWLISSGAVFGLAAGARLTSVAASTVMLAYEGWSRPRRLRGVVLAVSLSLLIGALMYASTFHRYGLLHLNFGRWNAIDYAINIIDGNLLFFGAQSVFVAPWLLSGPLVDLLRRDLRGRAALLVWCLVTVGGYEMLFAFAPLQVGYLLPALPAALILLGIVLEQWPKRLGALISLAMSSALVTVTVVDARGGVHRVGSALPPIVSWRMGTIRGLSTEMSCGFFVRWGYLVSDVAARRRVIEAERARTTVPSR